MASTVNPSSYMFTGEFRHSLDGKKRVTIPSGWRCNETDVFFIIPNPFNACLTVMPPEVFKQIGEEAKIKASSPEAYRIFARQFYPNSQQVSTDKQGRLLLPEAYCTQAGLVGDTFLVGNLDRFDIWNVENWIKLKQGSKEVYEEVARAVGL
jgi:MraZ protein